MALNLNNTLVVGVSATALFDLREADNLFSSLYQNNPDEAIDAYRAHMSIHENNPLEGGTALPLVKALLELNKYQAKGDSPLVEVIVMSRNSPDTGVRVLNTIKHYGLNISRSAFTAGESSADYLEAFSVDLFLTTNNSDAQKVIDKKICACAIVSAPPTLAYVPPLDQVRLAFDGDAVLFDESSELLYKQQGIDAFFEQEEREQNTPLNAGPYANFLQKLSRLQERLPHKIEYSPVRIAIVTARNSPADIRVIKTLRAWGVYADEAFFLGGVEKAKILEAFKPHIFFDDQDLHLDGASKLVPSGKVLYPTDSPLNKIKK